MPGCGKRDDFQCDTRVDIRYDNPPTYPHMTHVYMWISRWILWIIRGFTQKKRQTVQKWCIIAKEPLWIKKQNGTGSVNERYGD